jgi:hypothetical protein
MGPPEAGQRRSTSLRESQSQERPRLPAVSQDQRQRPGERPSRQPGVHPHTVLLRTSRRRCSTTGRDLPRACMPQMSPLRQRRRPRGRIRFAACRRCWAANVEASAARGGTLSARRHNAKAKWCGAGPILSSRESMHRPASTSAPCWAHGSYRARQGMRRASADVRSSVAFTLLITSV